VFLFEYAFFFFHFFPQYQVQASAKQLMQSSELKHLEYPTCDPTAAGIFALLEVGVCSPEDIGIPAWIFWLTATLSCTSEKGSKYRLCEWSISFL